MGMLESILFVIGRWFGYVGACMIAPDATCRPFLAFVALGAAASVALTIVVLAYRAAARRGAAEIGPVHVPGRELEPVERTRRVEPTLPRKPALEGHLHAA